MQAWVARWSKITISNKHHKAFLFSALSSYKVLNGPVPPSPKQTWVSKQQEGRKLPKADLWFFTSRTAGTTHQASGEIRTQCTEMPTFEMNRLCLSVCYT